MFGVLNETLLKKVNELNIITRIACCKTYPVPISKVENLFKSIKYSRTKMNI